MAESTIDRSVAALSSDSSQRRQRAMRLRSSSSVIEREDDVAPEKLDLKDELTIVVIGASGDLAKKKTYPALFKLFSLGLLPPQTHIIGYSRSVIEDADFKKRISAKFSDEPKAKEFLKLCTYEAGAYGDAAAYNKLKAAMVKKEESGGRTKVDRLFYLAIPPSLFAQVASNIRTHLFSKTGWNRLVVEKPFGRDLETFMELSNDLAMFMEPELYRIDHYLGKEMVQNLMVLRFANSFLNPLWNRHHVAAVVITFKEPIGVEGRGGYFDSFGIIRDVMQNHLLQMMSLVAMEPPVSLSAEDVRDEKTKVLRSVVIPTVDDVVLGQYSRNGSTEGYREHDDVPNDSRTPTFASVVLYVANERWRGVPFILKCGKGLNERKAEIRVQFRAPVPLFGKLPRNELVFRVQPDASVYLKTHIKVPGLETKLVMRDLDLTYSDHYDDTDSPDAYERLIYDVIRGDHNLFVRNDELLAAWNIFSPLLHELDDKKIEPKAYVYGSRGPEDADQLAQKHGYEYSEYKWQKIKKTNANL